MTLMKIPLFRYLKGWFAPRSADPAILYRERSLRFLLPLITVVRTLHFAGSYAYFPEGQKIYTPVFLGIPFFVIPIFLAFFFLAKKNVDLAGVCYIMHWYLLDLLNLRVEGYWTVGHEVSLIIQTVMSTLFLPRRVILPFLFFQITTVGIWGHWLEANHYFHPPLLATGKPMSTFTSVFGTVATQECLIVFISFYLRTQMEKTLSLQKVTINQLQTEITDRKKAEDALKESEERMHFLANAAFEGIGISDQGRVVEANDQLARMLGYSRDELIGMPVTQMVAPESREWVMARVLSGSKEPYEHLALRKDGSLFPVEVQARPIPFQGHSARVTAIRDITERKRAQEILENAQRTFRLASVGTLAAGISHEINQPLTALKVKVNGMLYWEEKDPGSLLKNLVPNLKFISSEAEKIDGIIRHMRSLIRREKVSPRPVDLNETVRSNLSVFRHQLASHNIHVDLRLGGGPPFAAADETSLGQVLLNLVTNAMHALDTMDQDYKAIRIATRSLASMAILVVSDNGPGISEENRKRIFEPLFTTQGEGTGLGLPIVQYFVQEYHGRVRVRNRRSGGTVFVVAYPAHKKPSTGGA